MESVISGSYVKYDGCRRWVFFTRVLSVNFRLYKQAVALEVSTGIHWHACCDL